MSDELKQFKWHLYLWNGEIKHKSQINVADPTIHEN